MNPIRQHARILTASLTGTAVEFYDFYVYATAAALVFGPLFFSFVYFQLKPTWPGLIWIVGGVVYLLALPLLLGIRRVPNATPAPEA